MKTNIIYKVSAVIATLVLSVSCTNQEHEAMSEGNNFTACIEQGLTRTTLIDNYYVGWYYGDRIMINGATYAASPKGNVATSADLIYVDGNIPAAPYKAIYPASLYDAGTGTYAFPETQEYQEGRFNAPMYAESNTKSLQFRNICGVLCFSLKGSEAIREIVISTYGGQYLCGPFSVDESGKAITNVGGGQQFGPVQAAKGGRVSMYNPYGTVRLDCGEDGVQLYENMARNFYVYLPAAVYEEGDLTVTVRSISDEEYTRTNTVDAVVDVNSIYTFNWDVFTDEESIDVEIEDPNSLTIIDSNPILSGRFTIDSYGTQVRFTHGNLYWNGNGWALEAHQYDCPNTGVYDAKHVNLFFWSTNAGASLGETSQIMSILEGTTPKFFCDGSDQDHCFFAKSSAEVSGSPLHALTSEQWEYILKGRTTFLSHSYAAAKINNVTGLLIFPDNFSEDGKKLVDWLGSNNYVTGLNGGDTAPADNIPTENWNSLEKEGVVFLPAAGYREGDKVYNDAGGRYWTSTFGNRQQQQPTWLNFTNSNWRLEEAHHYIGSAIRLVYQMPAVSE